MNIIVTLLLISLSCSAPIYNQSKAILNAKLSMITHCSTQQIESWNCRLCKDYPYMSHLSQIENKVAEISGFIGFDSLANAIVISWRGTVDTKNWIEDMDFKQRDFTFDSKCSKCKVHAGFYDSYELVSKKVKEKVSTLLGQFPTASIQITGHSLGGALATICALFLRKDYPTKIKDLYVYGCPRVGNYNFAQYIHSLMPKLFRVIHYQDIVPHLPPEDFQYRHSPYEVFYDEAMQKYKVCDQSGEDSQCSNKLWPHYSFDDHTLYWVKTDSSVC